MRAVYERWSFARHTDALAEMATDPEVMTFLGGPQTREDAADLSGRLEAHWDAHRFGLWAVMEGETCVGFSGACHPGPAFQPEFAHEVELGWRLARAAWGRGYATEGARLALQSLPDHLQLPRVVAFVHPDNARSQAVVARLGMRVAGTFRDRRLHVVEQVFERELAAA